MDKISFIIPSRDNLKYLKWCYNSIRKNLGDEHEICCGDDSSSDGTWEWLQEQSKVDKNLKTYKVESDNRRGLVLLYDELIRHCATNEVVMIFHADMYACPNLDKEVFKYLEKGKVVTVTRIEPSLHPPGPEKCLADYGVEPEEFDEDKLLSELKNFEDKTKITDGCFAPWAIYKEDFIRVGGHDRLFAPTSREDSDIFGRFVLHGYEFIQTWGSFVYHLTSRGSRFNPAGGGEVGKDSPEWQWSNNKNVRNYIRKWGGMVSHSSTLHPQVKPKYDIGFEPINVDEKLLKVLEPWCANLKISEWRPWVNDYIKSESKEVLDVFYTTPQTPEEKIPNDIISGKFVDELTNDVQISFDCRFLNPNNFQILTKMHEIIKDSGEVGEFELDIFQVKINKINNIVNENLQVSNNIYGV